MAEFIGGPVTRRYCKKPIEVEAFQWEQNMGPVIGSVCACRVGLTLNIGMHVHTLEGPLHVSDGDWIITGVKGEKYPCKPDVFAATYEVEPAA